MKNTKPGCFFEGGSEPMHFNALTKIEGPSERHIEQLWDEIKSLKKRIDYLENNSIKMIENSLRNHDGRILELEKQNGDKTNE